MLRSAPLWLIAFSMLTSEALALDTRPWEAAVARQCPSRHLERMCDGCYDEFLGGFERTLPKATQSKITRLADYSHRCREEIAGFSCEMAVHVDAMKRLGVFERFVAYGCKQYTCSFAGHCTRTESRQVR